MILDLDIMMSSEFSMFCRKNEKAAPNKRRRLAFIIEYRFERCMYYTAG